VENCPQGIPVNDILVLAWAELERKVPGPAAERFIFEKIFASPHLMEILRNLALPFQSIIFKKLNNLSVGRCRMALPGIGGLALPLFARPPRIMHGRTLPGVVKSRTVPGAVGKLLLFPGCMARYFSPSLINKCTEILNLCGFEVVVPASAACCGTPFLSLGYTKRARALAAGNLRIFEASGADAVVTPCPTCAFTIRHKYPLAFGTESPVTIEEIGEFIASRGLFDKFKSINISDVTYHDPCHLRRGLGAHDPPREALRRICGPAYREAPWAGQCCGFGGVFSFHYPDISRGVRGHVVESARASGIREIVTSCPACVFNIGAGCAEAGVPVTVRHLADILYDALRRD
jgi:glycolate oxidase iron-sulfur subunit